MSGKRAMHARVTAALLAVALLAATGCSSRPGATTATPVTVPSVVGMQADEAVDALESVGLEHDFSELVIIKSNWVVMAQSPEAGQSARTGDEIHLIVQKPEDALTDDERITRAESLALEELPDAPIWEGLTVQGTIVNQSEVCVDRTWPPGGGIDGGGGSAGYVIVTFPAEDVGEPRDGVCAEYAPATSIEDHVDVPESVVDEPGLMISTDYDDEWPFTVPWVVVRCDDLAVSVEAPDGVVYAGNGTALDHTDLPHIDPIWAEDPDLEGIKINIQPMVELGLSLCD